MNFDDIMREITSGLTGDPERDMRYLNEQCEIYKTHEMATEIIRAVGRLMYDIMPPELRESVTRLIDNNNLGEDAAIEEAEFQISKKNFGKALDILESLIGKIENDKGEFNVYLDDKVSEYHNFRNPFEDILYCEMNEPLKEVRNMRRNFDNLYYVYGALLFELERFDESEKALLKAIGINPIRVEAMFELGEIYKLRGDLERYMDLSKQCLKISYSGKNVARCFRNMGYYYVEKELYDAAVVMYYISMNFDRQTQIAQSELYYIQQTTGKPAPSFSSDEMEAICREHDVPFGPNDLVLEVAYTLGKMAENDKEYDASRFFYSIIYSLTRSDKVMEWIRNLP